MEGKRMKPRALDLFCGSGGATRGLQLAGFHVGWLTLLCGSMFGLQTPDGRAELRRHRVFETSFSIPLRPLCQHGYVESLSVTSTGLDSNRAAWERRRAIKVPQFNRRVGTLNVCGEYAEVNAWRKADRKVLTVTGHTPVDNTRRRAITITGSTPQTNTVRNEVRETFSIHDARASMGIDWMTMAGLSQAIPPLYAEFIGRQAMQVLITEAL